MNSNRRTPNNGHWPGYGDDSTTDLADQIYGELDLLLPETEDEPECTPNGRIDALDRDNAACYQLMKDLLKQYLHGEIDRETFDQRQWDLWDVSIGITRATLSERFR